MILKKIENAIGYVKARFAERSTYLFITGGMASVTTLPSPFNWIGFVLLFAAAMVPDRPEKPDA